ncbi:MAG TPA: prepilin-type N-terminal cleavage/methylation domain-containing protein [Verrucomicrobiaceae bacterium]|jgi:prepilin-type N-terminal cleavage/methylation domain-containing protein/prepilin-type processing-associated H-X9-DG protein
MRPRRHHPAATAGFTLMELLVVTVIIAALATLIIPGGDRLLHRARASACMNNLRNLGGALNLYLTDHNNIMPTLVISRESIGDDPPGLDTALLPYTEDRKAFRCPGDTKRLWETTGTSYIWNHLLNGQNVASLDFMGLITSGSRIPVMSDKENFHKYRDVEVNILYADGHVAKEIQFTVGGK